MEGRRASRDERIQASWAEVQKNAALAAEVTARAARRPPVCGGCQLYIRDPINPEAGLGTCQIGRLTRFPDEQHVCPERQPT
jgi:hypothetical protein